MGNKVLAILVLLIVEFTGVQAQVSWGNDIDSLLEYMIEYETRYDSTGPIVSSTDFGETHYSFPWLYLDKEGWESLPKSLEDPYFLDIHTRNLLALDRRSRVSSRTNVRRLKGIIERSTVAWYITGKPAYLNMAIAALMASCESAEWNVVPPSDNHINAADLRTGELLYIVSFGYDALFPFLNDIQKRACLKALIEKGLRAYLMGHARKDWWVNCDFNWNSALHGNAGLAAMVIRNSNPALSDYILGLATKGLPYMIASFYPGGGYIEGVMYQGTAIGHLTDFVVPYYKLTGDDLGLLKNEDFHNTLSFWIPMFAPDQKAYNFSDCSDENLYGIAQGFWWAQQLNRPDWAWDQERRTSSTIGAGGLFHDVEGFWYRKPYQETRPVTTRGLQHFKGIDWAIWRGNDSWLAFRSGFNGGNHDNDDLGNLILGYRSQRFLIDPGYGAIDASDHNCITVRGHEQTDCATGKIVKAVGNGNGFYLVSDIREAFPYTVSHYNRHLLLIDDTHLLMVDDVKGAEENRVWVKGHLQTRSPVTRTASGWEIMGSTDTCHIDLLFDFGIHKEEQWNFGGPITKLIYQDIYDRNHSVQPVLFRFSDTPYSYHATQEGFTLEIGEAMHRFIFEDDQLIYLDPAR